MSKVKTLTAGQVIAIAGRSGFRDLEFNDLICVSRAYLGRLRTVDASETITPRNSLTIVDTFPSLAKDYLTDMEISLLRGHVAKTDKVAATKNVTKVAQVRTVTQDNMFPAEVKLDAELESIKKTIVGVAGYRKGQDIREHNIELNDDLLLAIIGELR